jgi:hypothetical protein
MKSLIAGFILVVLGSCVYGTASTPEKVSAIQADAQIIRDNLRPLLVQKRLAFGDSWWPTDLASRPVRPDDIPKEVLTKATAWLRTMVKGQWLPEDPNTWMIGVRKQTPTKADYLILRYKVENRTIQIQENGAFVCILIDTGSQSEMKPEAFLTNVIRTFLRFPEDKLATLRFYLDHFEQDGLSIWYGTIDCDFNRDDRDAYFRRIWYNQTDVWTDGQRVFFSLVEKDGRPWKPVRVTPDIPRRFKPTE